MFHFQNTIRIHVCLPAELPGYFSLSGIIYYTNTALRLPKKMHLLNKCSCYMLVSFLLFFFNESQYKHVHVNKIEKENKFNYG